MVYVPDVHSGDSLPIEFLDDAEPKLDVREQEGVLGKTTRTAKIGATLGPWLVSHREAVSKPIIDKFIKDIKYTPGTNKYATKQGGAGELVMLTGRAGWERLASAGAAATPFYPHTATSTPLQHFTHPSSPCRAISRASKTPCTSVSVTRTRCCQRTR